MTVPLPIPDDPRIARLVYEWPDFTRWPFRSRWLRECEDVLCGWYPQASARELSVTARGLAPFYLAAGHNVP